MLHTQNFFIFRISFADHIQRILQITSITVSNRTHLATHNIEIDLIVMIKAHGDNTFPMARAIEEVESNQTHSCDRTKLDKQNERKKSGREQK